MSSVTLPLVVRVIPPPAPGLLLPLPLIPAASGTVRPDVFCDGKGQNQGTQLRTGGDPMKSPKRRSVWCGQQSKAQKGKDSPVASFQIKEIQKVPIHENKSCGSLTLQQYPQKRMLHIRLGWAGVENVTPKTLSLKCGSVLPARIFACVGGQRCSRRHALPPTFRPNAQSPLNGTWGRPASCLRPADSLWTLGAHKGRKAFSCI